MRLSTQLLLLLNWHASIVSTSPVPLEAEPDYAYHIERAACATYCGYSSQTCCSAGYVCYTDQNNDAQCTTTAVYNPTPATAAGFATTSTSTLICNGNVGQTACGNKCCNAGQTCLQPGQCGGTTATLAVMTTATVTSVSVTAVGVTAATTITTTTAGRTFLSDHLNSSYVLNLT
jgi:hypothetical protein